jgi:tRNA-specific 2-thiouridylase
MMRIRDKEEGISGAPPTSYPLSPARVVVAMSGGVDSSTAAALLVEEGYEVIGIMMRLWAEEGEGGTANRCCSPEAVEDARRVCQVLGIPFYLVNYEKDFKQRVVDYFIGEYASGRTPNPCLACNRHIKFGLLLRRALSLDAQYLASGHYARIRRANGHYQLLKGVDRWKDQSYALYMLGQEALAHLLFPLGDYTKDEVRAIALDRGLPIAEKAESQELCFVHDDDYRRFLRTHAPETIKPGPIVDTAGRVIGQHKGLPFYTIGQREGMGIAAPEALYVLEMDVARNTIVACTKAELGRRELIAHQVSFVSGEAPASPMKVTAKIRYKAVEAKATLTPVDENSVALTFVEPQRDITPGQGVVFYRGDIVLGGGIIA